jgi:PAS domain S-box-containing protein
MKTQASDGRSQLFNLLREWVSRSPIAAFTIMAAAMFLAESFSGWIILERLPLLEQYEPLVEFLLNTGVVMPILLFLFVLPTARNIRRREVSERALRIMHNELEHKVRERTLDLEQTNRRLRQEVEERRRVQQAVEFQASLLDAVREAVVATDGDGRVLYWNRFAEQLYGRDAAKAMDSHLYEIVTFYQANGEPLDALEKCGQDSGCSSEVEVERQDGHRFPAYLLCSRLPADADGYIYLAFDFTERKAAEEALRDSEEKYSNLVENSPTGVFIFQQDGFVFVNPKFAKLLEYTREELLRQAPFQIVHPDDRERVMEIARNRMKGEPVSDHYECRLVTRTGKVRWVATCNAIIRHEGDCATLGNVQDVTDRKHMETEMRRLSARLLTIQEEERHRVARDLHDSVGQKLTGIKFMVEAAVGAPWPNERRTSIERLKSLVPTIQDAVEEVRCISSALRPSILDDLGLLPTLAWYLREFTKTQPQLKIEQRIMAEESDLPASLRTPIFRILQEATNNLAKHSNASQVVIELMVENNSLRLGIQDNGVGFEPGSLGEENKWGSGLGSMRERAELSGGYFELISIPGNGTRIQVDWRLDAVING